MLEKLFAIQERGSTVRTELLAGLTTFMTMAYILAVNPNILSASGMNAPSVFVATALCTCLATAAAGLFANLPIALAPSMGLNAFFTYTIVLGMGYSWQFALTAVFIAGVIFIGLTLSRLREIIMNCLPEGIKHAISVGIGLFIAFIGLKSAGIVVDNPNTFVMAGSFKDPGVIVAAVGTIFTGILLCRKVPGALLYGIFAATLLGIPLGVTKLANFDTAALFSVPSLAPTFWQFDWSLVLTLDMLLIVIAILFANLFDTMGGLIGLASQAGLLTEKGEVPNMKSAFMADALGTTVGSMMGTATVAVYVESASGIAEGGKTGLTAITVAVLFFLAIFLSPIFLLIPAQATAAALILVGLFMLVPIQKINFDDFTVSIPAFFTLIMMPLTYSIVNGIMWGLLAHVILQIGTGKGKQLNLISYVLALIFIIKLIFE